MENILINENVAKLGDLGSSKVFYESDDNYSFVGSRITMAPEILNDNKYDS